MKHRASRRKSTQAHTERTDDAVTISGTVTRAHPNATFDVAIEGGATVLGYVSGRLRKFRIRVLVGDRVDVEMSPYDLSKGRIVYRYRAGEAARA